MLGNLGNFEAAAN